MARRTASTVGANQIMANRLIEIVLDKHTSLDANAAAVAAGLFAFASTIDRLVTLIELAVSEDNKVAKEEALAHARAEGFEEGRSQGYAMAVKDAAQ